MFLHALLQLCKEQNLVHALLRDVGRAGPPPAGDCPVGCEMAKAVRCAAVFPLLCPVVVLPCIHSEQDQRGGRAPASGSI